MHMADALLSPTVGTTLWAGTAALGGYASKKLKIQMDDRMIPLMGVLGAFVFAAQMINFTIPGQDRADTCWDDLAILLGPHAVSGDGLDSAVQALSLRRRCSGARLQYLEPRVLPLLPGASADLQAAHREESKSERILFASLVAAITALQLGAFPSIGNASVRQSELPFGAFLLLLMQPIHRRSNDRRCWQDRQCVYRVSRNPKAWLI